MKENENIYLALKALYEASKKIQKKFPIKHEGGMCYTAYIREYCSIKCSTSRRGGHDYGIAEFVHNQPVKPLVSSTSKGARHLILKHEIKEYSEKHKDKQHSCQFSIMKDFIENETHFEDINCIIINDSYILTDNEEIQVYKYAGKIFSEKIDNEEHVCVIFVH